MSESLGVVTQAAPILVDEKEALGSSLNSGHHFTRVPYYNWGPKKGP